MKLGKLYTLVGIKELHVNRIDGISVGYDGLEIQNTDELDDIVLEDLDNGNLTVNDIVTGIGAVAEVSLDENNDFVFNAVNDYAEIEEDIEEEDEDDNDDSDDGDDGDDYNYDADYDSIVSYEDDE